MFVDIIVLPEDESPIASWLFWRNTANEFVITDRSNNTVYSPLDAWKELPSKLNELYIKRPYSGVDVFLRWRYPSFTDPITLRALTNLVDNARNHSWGGRVYLAWNQSEAPFDNCCFDESLENWFLAIANSGLTGLIELRDDYYQNNNHIPLAISAQNARCRRKELMRFVSEHGWIAILRGGESIEVLIDGLIRKDVLPADSENEIFVHDRSPTRNNDLENMDRRSRWEKRKGIAFRADVTGTRLQALPGLPMIHFNGVFEWLYSFIQLNQGRKHSRPHTKRVRKDARVVWVNEPSEKKSL